MKKLLEKCLLALNQIPNTEYALGKKTYDLASRIEKELKRDK